MRLRTKNIRTTPYNMFPDSPSTPSNFTGNRKIRKKMSKNVYTNEIM